MSHQMDMTVRGYHIDVYGHVNNARYLEFLEAARWAACESKQEILTWFMQQRLALTVQRIEIDYKRPATMGERLRVETKKVESTAKYCLLQQNIKRQSDDKLVVSANVFICVVSSSQRGALTLEGEIADKLSVLLD